MVNAFMKSFKPGDSIFLKRGEIFHTALEIRCSGTEKAPIVFTSYGNSLVSPLFLFRGSKTAENFSAVKFINCRYIVFEGLQITDDRIDAKDHAVQANIAVAINIDNSDFITIRKMDVSLVGVGVNVVGNKNLVDSCKFKNLRMIKNTPGGDDDYGANPVVLAGSGNTVSNCFFKECWANSFDYTFDGGAIEVFGPVTDSNRIINNTAINCDGFMEIGSLTGGSCNNILVSGNTIINCGELVYMSTDGKYKISVHNLQFFNNVIIHSVHQLTHPTSMIGMKTASDSKGIVNLQNNIFWLSSGIDVARNSQFTNGQMVHRNNTYYLPAGKLNFIADTSDLILNKNSPISKKLLAMHPEFSDLDQYPYILLLKKLDQFIF